MMPESSVKKSLRSYNGVSFKYNRISISPAFSGTRKAPIFGLLNNDAIPDFCGGR
jgi:hypothetical protein